MNPIIPNIGYLIIIIGTFVVRYPYQKRNKANKIERNEKDSIEKFTLALVFLGMMIIPLVFILTDILNFANYNLPFPWRAIGLLIIFPTLWLFYRSHKDLGLNWSVSLEIREKHTIIDQGVYKYIRHPMYSSIWLWTIAQILLLNNYIAGLSGIISFGILYFLRVNREEKMMIETFGRSYQNYISRTKRIIPFLY
ncbi:MAG: protein-S-isoprenylcysteine O-methyltransferase [Bacteroidota bacterium]